MAFKLAELFVDINGNDGPLSRTLAGVRRNLGRVATAGAVAGGAAGVALGAGLAVGVRRAGDLAETGAKVQEVFGDAAGAVVADAERMARGFGTPRQAMLDAASSIGLIAKAAGQSDAAAAGMATQMARLAADASSFYNVPLEEALTSIRSGLVGEAEPLRRFGVLLNEDAVKAQALAMGLAKAGQELTEQQKTMARASLIAHGLAKANGDLARTAGSFSNQVRELQGRFANLLAELGGRLLPAATTVARTLNLLFMDVERSVARAGDRIGHVGDRAAAMAKYVAVAWRELPLVLELGRLKLEQLGMKAEAVGRRAGIALLDGLEYASGQIATFVTNLATGLANVLVDAFSRIGDRIAAQVHNAIAGSAIGFGLDYRPVPSVTPDLRKFGNPLDGLRPPEADLGALARDLPDNGFDAKFADAAGKLSESLRALEGEMEAARKAAGATPKAQGPKPEAGAAKAKKEREERAQTLDLAAFAQKLQEGAFGRGDAAETRRNTAKLVGLQERSVQLQERAMSKPPAPGVAVA